MSKDDIILEKILALDDAWCKFFNSIGNIQITVSSASLLIPFLEKFKELKQFMEILKE